MGKLTATRALRYQGKVYSAGETFETATDREGDEFVTKKYATRESTAKAGSYKTRDMRAESQAQAQAPAAGKQADAPSSTAVGATTTSDFMGPKP